MDAEQIMEQLRSEHDRLLPFLKSQPGYSYSGVSIDNTGRTCIKVTGHGMPREVQEQILEHLTANNLPGAVVDSPSSIQLL